MYIVFRKTKFQIDHNSNLNNVCRNLKPAQDNRYGFKIE